MVKKFKNAIKERPVLGMFMKTNDPSFVEIAGRAGFDFVVLDTEHGVTSLESIQNNIRAAQVGGVLPIIRIPQISEHDISKPLDIGAMGIQVPQVTTSDEAKKVVEFAKFYPEGSRGVCRFVRAAGFSSIERNDYFKQANESLVIVQLEGEEALKNVDEILDVKGIDILFIGPYDLSQSLGVPGQVSHPKVIKAMETIVNKAIAKDVVIGTFVDTKEDLERWEKAGVKYLAYSVDVGLFYDHCKLISDGFNKLISE